MGFNLTRLAAGAVALGTLVALGAPAYADDAIDTSACVSAYEQGQRLQRKGELLAAREQLLVCGRSPCPAVLQRDCVQWLAQVESAIPSIVVAARDANGADITDVKVTVDGRPIAAHLDGRPIELDPGPHTFEFEHGTSAPVERQLVLREGEKSRSIAIGFEPVAAPTTRRVSKRSPALAIAASVLGGVGAVALGTFTYFAVRGRSEQTSTLDACRPNCSSAQIDDVHTDYLIADVSLGVAVATIGVAVALAIVHVRAGASVHAAMARPLAITF